MYRWCIKDISVVYKGYIYGVLVLQIKAEAAQRGYTASAEWGFRICVLRANKQIGNYLINFLPPWMYMPAGRALMSVPMGCPRMV